MHALLRPCKCKITQVSTLECSRSDTYQANLCSAIFQGNGDGAELQSELTRLQDENSILRRRLTEARAVRPPQPDGGPGDFQAQEAIREIQLVSLVVSGGQTC